MGVEIDPMPNKGRNGRGIDAIAAASATHAHAGNINPLAVYTIVGRLHIVQFLRRHMSVNTGHCFKPLGDGKCG